MQIPKLRYFKPFEFFDHTGLGFSVARREGYVAFEHGGAVAGYTATLIINRAKGIAVIVLSNGAANPDSLGERALDMLSK